ncbi:MAG: XdhC family protein [Desulfurellaceae bacterium]|nr:XdhC family protein [Desulfurellaceae bacterium]
MDDLWDRAEALLADGKSFVLATIIRTRGSVPREVGAKMVVPPEGQPFGTIGGGCGEGEVLRRAYPVLEQNLPPRIVEVDLTGDFDQDVIQVCGGLMDVALDVWRPEEHRELAHSLAEATRARRPAALVTALDAVGGSLSPGAKGCLSVGRGGPALSPALSLDQPLVETFSASVSDGKSQLFAVSPQGQAVEEVVARRQDWPKVFVDVQSGQQTLIIAGAGHIAQPLCEIAHLMGFRTIVVDDRWAFANTERFPHAADIRVGPFGQVLDSLEINEQTFVVVVTRGHVHDEESVRVALHKTPAYIGMIGSKRRAKTTLERLAEQGFSSTPPWVWILRLRRRPKSP